MIISRLVTHKYTFPWKARKYTLYHYLRDDNYLTCNGVTWLSKTRDDKILCILLTYNDRTVAIRERSFTPHFSMYFVVEMSCTFLEMIMSNWLLCSDETYNWLLHRFWCFNWRFNCSSYQCCSSDLVTFIDISLKFDWFTDEERRTMSCLHEVIQ